jgi:hypothetical protein
MATCSKCGSELPDGAGRCLACDTTLESTAFEPEIDSGQTGSSNRQRMVAVRSFTGPRAALDAGMAKSFLEAEGIPCMVPGESSASALPGIDVLNLLVREQDAPQAAEILKSLLDIPPEDTGD